MGKRDKSAAAERPTSEQPLSYERRAARVHTTQLLRSPLNPRKHKTSGDDAKIAELAQSIARVGVLEPPLVRELEPRSDVEDERMYEVLAGERRWRAAALAAATVPERAFVDVVVLDVPDDVAFEIATIENDQREDPHPLDQCDAFVRLRDEYGRSPEQIAAKIGRTPRYVYDRLRLEKLCDAARTALLDGRIHLTVALILARVSSADVQRRITADLLKKHKDQDVPVYAAKEAVKRRLMVIAQAPFDTKSKTLVPSAGPCTTCPKTSETQRELFGDLDEHDSANRCTDPDCWDQKSEIAWAQQTADAEKRGVRVASAKESREIFPAEWAGAGKGYVELDGKDFMTEGRTWRDLLGKKRLEGIEVLLVRDARGRAVEVAKRADLLNAIEASPSSTDPASVAGSSEGSGSRDTRDYKLEREIEEESHRRVIGALVQAVEGGGSKNNLDFWRAFAAVMIEDSADCESPTDPAKRRGLITSDELDADEPADEKLMKAAADMDAAQLLGLIVEVVVWRKIYDARSEKGKPTPLGSLLDALSINRKHHEREAAKAVKAARKSKEKGSVAKSATKKKSRAELDADEAEERREQMEDAYAGE